MDSSLLVLWNGFYYRGINSKSSNKRIPEKDASKMVLRITAAFNNKIFKIILEINF